LLLAAVGLIGTVLGLLLWLGSNAHLSGRQLGFALLLGICGVALTLLYRDKLPAQRKPSKLLAGLALFLGAGAGGLVVLGLIVFALMEALKHP
jgi:hypothetical protein